MSKSNGAYQTDTRAAAHDDYCTPPKLLAALGKFDFDPCCPKGGMAWKTARRTVSPPRDGLTVAWSGRVWLNPPYMQGIGLWLEKLALHGNGMALVPAKSTDTRWSQAALSDCDAVYFMAGRLLFFRPDGTETDGKWMPSMLLAYGKRNSAILGSAKFARAYPGILMRKL